MKVVCGALIVKDGKIVLVKEAKKSAYGKWNIPAGGLNDGEGIMAATKREIKEETDLDIDLEGLVGIYQHRRHDGTTGIKFIFKASVRSGTLKPREGELLDAGWFSFGEVGGMPEDDIRKSSNVKRIINDYMERGILDLGIVHSTGLC
jgi:ADP-ribose pyrophosphatase YjhB (NUDIX family)